LYCAMQQEAWALHGMRLVTPLLSIIWRNEGGTARAVPVQS
jgi:hypothetical protein